MNKGLNSNEVLENRERFGANIIEEAKPKTFFEEVKEAAGDAMIKILIFAAVVMSVLACMGLIPWLDPMGILFAILLFLGVTAGTAVWTSKQFAKTKSGIKKDTCRVIRDGKVQEIDFDELVVGDLVLLQSGEKIHADGVMLNGKIKVDNATLNGETEPCKKHGRGEVNYIELAEEVVKITGDMIVDRFNLFKGAVVVDGEGEMIVTKVGMNTMMGAMAAEMNEEKIDSPMTVKLTKLAEIISKVGYTVAALILVILSIKHILTLGGVGAFFAQGWATCLSDVLNIVTMAVVIIVMAVPEGLPLMISLVLNQNTSKLLKANVLVKDAKGIETAGSLNILFSDKTGTITGGKLEVVAVSDGVKETNDDILDTIKRTIAYSTASSFDIEGNVIGGNVTDVALTKFIGQAFMESCNEEVSARQEFNSRNKFTAVEINGRTYYKGAPDKLLDNSIQSEEHKEQVRKNIASYTNRAMRVIGFAVSEKPLVEDTLNDDLVFVGFTGIRDDVRLDAKEAIEKVQRAGVQVVMITGDCLETATAIAKESGLVQNEEDLIVTSAELNEMSDEEVKSIIPNLRVISRATPADKSRMVKLSQELGLVCGMTGDGVNDSPALRKADVGFAMGSGTDVAKETGDIIILDDSLMSIQKAIHFGRTIYRNIQKFIMFQLTVNVGAVLVSLVTPLLGIEQPLAVMHILWLNLVMDCLGALALGGEPSLEAYMLEKPKSRTESIVSKEMFGRVLTAGITITALSLLMLLSPVFKEIFPTNEELISAHFTMFVLAAVLNGFNVRSNTENLFEHIGENTMFIKIMAIIAVVQFSLTTFGGSLFHCTPLSLYQWATVLVMAFTIVPVDLVRKSLMNKNN